MNFNSGFDVAVAVALGLCWPSVALACSDPSEKWYANVSDVVFDGMAICEPDKRTCQIRVAKVLKNAMRLAIERRPFEVDFQNWFEDNRDPDFIIITCGVPVFEPEETRLRGRFYANFDKKTSKLIVRTYRVKAGTPQ